MLARGRGAWLAFLSRTASISASTKAESNFGAASFMRIHISDSHMKSLALDTKKRSQQFGGRLATP